MKLSKNFSLKELTASQTAERKGINNNLMTTKLQHCKNFVRIFYNLLETIMLHQ